MPTNRDVEDFFELRQGFQGMADFADAALRFLDKNGIALQGRSNGAHGPKPKRLSPTLRERVKRHYTKRRTFVATDAVPLRQTSDIPITPKRAHSYGEKKIEGRRLSARVLDALDRVEPRAVLPEGTRTIGALVRRGYARKKGDGYIKTAKVFTVGEKPESQAPTAPEGNGALLSDALTVAQAAKILKVSDSYVRLLVKGGKMTARQEMRPRRGMHKPAPTMVLDRDEVARYQANTV